MVVGSSVDDLLTLAAGAARLVLAPALGGGIAHLDLGGKPVLRPWNGNRDNPFSLASNVLVPFSNRISDGGFNWDSTYHPVSANLKGEALAIHGDGFQRPWHVAESSENAAHIQLRAGNIGPFRYCAEQVFQLAETGLKIGLTVTNTGPVELPFGFGFHPWFPRSDETRISFEADGVWMEDSQFLPTEYLPLTDAPDWSFHRPRALPDGWINNGYTNWQRTAQITQGPAHVSVAISASDNLSTAIVHSPHASADFVCFEPVSHPVDAFHLTGHPGLCPLVPSQSMESWMTLQWS